VTSVVSFLKIFKTSLKISLMGCVYLDQRSIFSRTFAVKRNYWRLQRW